ncbi:MULTISPECIES: RidA family protein [Burkholderia]|uniref:Enamine deaminase RidA n=1 Tax=Burkholderia mayonis TaxID=1385591 RepID=A0A1B4FPF3_9BURK|nr:MULTISPECIES: RidA family protein [Burkholderia]AOJ05546.1 enamine deaminase RidA [Burkholderia mayonis]KVE41102.1 enamine deaminase RidA [Burkholderia sp. BDU5]KVE47738.1 enamine deaminase RidA [Burkholderia mayonis]
MPDLIPVDLPEPAQPFSWATHAHGLMFTAHGPVDAAGAIVGGDIAQQARLALSNLASAVRAAKARMQDVVQVLLYVADARDIPVIDTVYRECFDAPYPNRACVAVQGFAHPDMRIELVAYVALGQPASRAAG